MRSFVAACLNAAALAGASYADVRVVDSATQDISTRNGVVEGVESSSSFGFGMRVIADGAWGFASSADVSPDGAVRVAREAVAIAKASATLGSHTVRLADTPAVEDSWTGPCETDPFTVSLEDKIALLLAADEAMRGEDGIRVAEGHLGFLRTAKTFASSEGAYITQGWVESQAEIVATAVGGDRVCPRSYPNSLGGSVVQGGWESVLALDLVGNASRIVDEALELLTAPECPSGTTTLVIDSAMLALQIHESIGHPTELDRVLGDEAAFAGTSWVGTDDLGTLRYGSDKVDITADATVPGSIGSFGYDDEGVPAQRDYLVRDGILTGFQSSRESAVAIGRSSNGCMRADGWSRVPIIRMTTISLEPGEAGSLADLVADTDDGILLGCNKSWSIDDKRLNFQFACEIGWEIRGGEIGRILYNPNYTGITPRFWGSCDAVCSQEAWTVWGVNNCGKGEPMQVAHVAHGAAPARFRDVEVGVGR